MNIIWKGSPNHDSNRKPIKKIVIHWFGMGTLAGADATFQKPGGTSAHYGISDSTVYQWVKESDVAYHAGNYSVNQESIGIEHDANPDKPLSEQSYKTSGQLVREICDRYNLPIDRNTIIKHSEVPRATACPGTIDLDKIIKIAKGEQGGSMVEVDSAKFEELVNKATKYDEFVASGYNNVQGINDVVSGLEDEVDRLETDKKYLQEQVRTAEFEKAKLAEQLEECQKNSSGSPVDIQEKVEVAGKNWLINGVIVDSDGKVSANYKLKEG